MIRVLSLGAGVQSTALALMAAAGEIGPMPDHAIFADTQWEPARVYEQLAWVTARVPFPVHIVTAGNIRADILARSNTSGGSFAVVPWHMQAPNGAASMGRRQCTREYKVRPIQKKVVELLGGRRGRGACEMWIGISRDEASRMKPSRVGYIVHRWPLIERNLTRSACLRWLDRAGFHEPPKSACIGCPFHSDRTWRALRDERPTEWADAIAVDAAIRDQPGSRGRQFMHRALVPLAEVDLRTAEDMGQINLFENECEGLCGV